MRPRGRNLVLLFAVLLGSLLLPGVLSTAYGDVTAETSSAMELFQLATLTMVIVAKLCRRRAWKRRVMHSGRILHVGPGRRIGKGTRPHKHKGQPRFFWLKGLKAWRRRTDDRKSAYETAFLDDAEHWVDEPSSVLYQDFTLQFRVPFPVFDDLLTMTRESGRFPDEKAKKKGAPPIPLALKVLACLRFLATGMSFASLQLECGVSKAVLSKFYDQWTSWLVETQYDKYICIPQSHQEIDRIQQIFCKLGLPGCCSSMDGVHVAWDNCPERYRFNYIGKEGYPTLAWNVHSDHLGRILHVNGPHAGGRNDKTMARLDSMLKAVKECPVFTNFQFTLMTTMGEAVQHTGAWVLCDGGYHLWKTTICAFKHSIAPKNLIWSTLMGSIRKNIEDVFGMLKRRFRVLKVPFLLPTEEGIDKTFRVCCLLHNMLLHHRNMLDIGQSDEDWKLAENAAFNRLVQRDARFAKAVETVRRTSRIFTDGQKAMIIDTNTDMCSIGPLMLDAAEAVEIEPGFKEMREALVDHCFHEMSIGRLQWLKTVNERRQQSHGSDDD